MAKEENRPIQQSVHIDCPIEDAFRLFTERFADWWPLAAHSATGGESETCEIEPWAGGRVFERTRSGQECEWGSVLVWDPPGRVEFTWNPASPGDRNQTVEVEFVVEADGTRVTLTHRGWESTRVETCALQSGSASPGFESPWPAILKIRFCEFVASEMVLTA